MDNNNMKYITVLDFEAGRVYQYKVWDFFRNNCEEYLTEQGHNLSNCEWMIHSNNEIITE